MGGQLRQGGVEVLHQAGDDAILEQGWAGAGV